MSINFQFKCIHDELNLYDFLPELFSNINISIPLLLLNIFPSS